MPWTFSCRPPAAATVLIGSLLAATAVAAAPTTIPAATDPASFDYAPLPDDGAVDFRIDEQSPRFEFHSGSSGYRAFRLPAAARPYGIDVISYLEGGDTPDTARVFYPLVALLTDDFLVSRRTEIEELRFDAPFLMRSQMPAYRISIGVDPAQSPERYLVVFTPKATADDDDTALISTPDEAAESLHRHPVGASTRGHLRLRIHPLPAAPKDDAAH